MAWRDAGAFICAGGVEVEGISVPLTLGGIAEGRLVYAGRGVGEEEWRDVDAKGNVVLVELYDRDPDELKTAYSNAVERGAAALVVFDFAPGDCAGSWSLALGTTG